MAASIEALRQRATELKARLYAPPPEIAIRAELERVGSEIEDARRLEQAAREREAARRAEAAAPAIKAAGAETLKALRLFLAAYDAEQAARARVAVSGVELFTPPAVPLSLVAPLRRFVQEKTQ